ncbi:MAG: PIN domain-containing protein [Verrucomicrobia bacterium]|nr:PIN domain-containing protein [Verrucomicrobiota bacterium]
MGVILDSSVLIAAERRKFDLVGLLRAHDDEVFQIAAITASELLHGCARATDAVVRERRIRFVEGIIRDFAVAPFTLAEAREHARLWAGLEIQGQMIGPRDLEIAATALTLGFSMATRNLAEFQRVPGLRLLNVAPFARP